MVEEIATVLFYGLVCLVLLSCLVAGVVIYLGRWVE